MRHFQVNWCLFFWRENSNVVEITKKGLTFEKTLPLNAEKMHIFVSISK